MYKMKGRVRYSECGADGKLTLTALINYFQDCTSENSKLLGVGDHFLKERKRAWVLNTWQIEVSRYPEYSEEIEVSPWATGFKGILGPRDFCIKTVSGEELARATTLWVYVDTETGRPTKPEEDEIAAYTLGEPQEMEKVSRKIDLPEEAVWVDTFQVRKYHIDTNNHVNNAQYISAATEILPEGFQVKKLRAEYKKAALLGDTLQVNRAEENDRSVAELCDEDGKPYVVVEFRGEN